jgi:hypothetical protein
MSIDHLVIAVRELDVADQLDSALRWIERIVERSGNDCAKTFTLPECCPIGGRISSPPTKLIVGSEWLTVWWLPATVESLIWLTGK